MFNSGNNVVISEQKDETVKFLASVSSVALAVFISGLAPSIASAQSGSSGIRSASSSGLTAEVVGVAYAQNQVSIEIIIKNSNNFRVYVTDARTDGSQEGFLGSGGTLNSPFPKGIPYCNSDYADCATNQSETAIRKFSYIEPGSSVGVDMQYSSQQPPSHSDTISFSVTLMARFAKSDADSSADDAGQVREVTFPFPFIPIFRNN